MNPSQTKKHVQIPIWGCIALILAGLGISFRIAHLDRPIYWVDEVATSMRVSGYLRDEVARSLATGLPLSPADLLEFQQIRRDLPWFHLLQVLGQSPEHSPLYFLLARIWAECFGTSVTAMRSLSVGFGLLALPAMYGLGRSLFATPRQDTTEAGKLVGWLAMGLFAISPLFVAYAQEARPYSLWILLLILLQRFLWRSLEQGKGWFFYTLCLILSLYTSLLTLFVVLGQGCAAIWLYPQRRRMYLLTTAIAFFVFLPWCWVAIAAWPTLQNNTTWMQMPMPLWAILGVWFYSLAVLFFDVPVAAGMPAIMGIQIVVAIATVSCIGYATYFLLRHAPRSLGLFVLMGGISTPLTLLAIDLIRNGQAAATTRYLMPVHLGASIAVAYLCSYFTADRRTLPKAIALPFPIPVGRFIIVAILSVSLLSCVVGLDRTSNYQKSRNLSNPAIVHLLNQARSPQFLGEVGQIQDLISLSYQLDPDVSIQIRPPHLSHEAWLENAVNPQQTTFLFNPSPSMKSAVQTLQIGKLQQVYEPIKLIPSQLGLTLWIIDN
ncbi:glycosyltransferase family 39 protein [Spirulina sp. 06S082]|uniref:glycosyltransferase family 39 protein n=1 Tax=Spirulina sp. 06S082 TaxID=3110248 RepID=UPI002B1F2A59|nr:glycosyltransferase family 39 protein [Spirulina sp. 06S082]MEA5471093.1 glycosyltransferase family 39 protein [Spirulina sp. 06S082]